MEIGKCSNIMMSSLEIGKIGFNMWELSFEYPVYINNR